MKITSIFFLFLLINFSFLHCMNDKQNNQINDTDLQQIIQHANQSSLHVVDLVKKQIQDNDKSLTLENIKSSLHLERNDINKIFLQNIENNNVRKLMLSLGADINTCDKSGNNCLWYTHKPEILEQLIDDGADINTLNNKKFTPLHNLLLVPDKIFIPAIKTLLTKNANPNTPMPIFTSALHRVIKDPTNEVSFEIAELLCQFGAYTHITDDAGETPLTLAITRGSIALVKLLLENGAQADQQTQYNQYPLHLAIPEHFFNNLCVAKPTIVTLLLQHNANPNRLYRCSKLLPIHIAIKNKQFEVVKILAIAGAKTHYPDNNGYTCYTLACKAGCPDDILELLQAKQPEEDDSQEEANSTCSIQ